MHGVLEEVLLTPSGEHPDGQFIVIECVCGADQAGLMAGIVEFSHFFDPQGLVSAADQRSSFGQFHFNLVAAGHDDSF